MLQFPNLERPFRVEHMSTQGTKSKHIRAVEHAAQNPLILGLFLPTSIRSLEPVDRAARDIVDVRL